MERTESPPVESTKRIHSVWLWRIPIALLMLSSGMFIFREFAYSRRMAITQQCQENLTKIAGSKEQWALEYNKSKGETPTVNDLDAPQGEAYLKPIPRKCPSGLGDYVINPIGTDPVCTSGLPGHTLSEVGLPITQLESE